MHADSSHLTDVEGGVTAPKGFSAAGVHCGLKKTGALDIALVTAESPVPASAVFTTSNVVAAPVIVSRRHILQGRCQAVVINAGNANACTGAQGLTHAEKTAHAVAEQIGCTPEHVVVCSTGVIGVPMNVDLVLAGVDAAAGALSPHGGANAAEAIMTTDTVLKQCAVTFEVDGRRYTVGGMAKGSGMIAPNMATMLGVVTTDAPLTPEACEAALKSATSVTFNRVTVDSDTSTNDTVVLMASGAGGGEIGPRHASYAPVAAAITAVCLQLARMIARDGEGATKLVIVNVSGASDERDAEKAAKAIADSPLVKTALFGRDANWGRVAMAAGKSGARVDQGNLAIRFAGIEVCKDGTAVGFDEDEALEALSADEVHIDVDLGAGEANAAVMTCDLSYEYVRINGEYRS